MLIEKLGIVTHVTDIVVSALTVLVTRVSDSTVVTTVVVWTTVVKAVDGVGVMVLVKWVACTVGAVVAPWHVTVFVDVGPVL